MIKIILLLSTVITFMVSAQTVSVYSKAYGKSTDSPIIFIHGGPSGNSTFFEATTAQKLQIRDFMLSCMTVVVKGARLTSLQHLPTLEPLKI